MITQKDLEIKINTSVDAGNAAPSISALRNQIRELNSVALQFGDEFPAAAKKAQQEAAKLADKLDDTRENLNDLKGEPLERIRASVARLQEGFMNMDLGKITQSFKNLGAAVTSAGGIFALLIGAVVLIIENFDTLKNSGGLVGAIFTTIGNVVDFVKIMFLELADAIGLVDKEMVNSMNSDKKAKDSKDALADSTKLYNKSQERELQLMRARGEESDKILKKEQQFLNQQIDLLDKAIKEEEDRQQELKKARELERSKEPGLVSKALSILPGATQVSQISTAIKMKNRAEEEAAEKKKLDLLKEQRDEFKFQLKLRKEQLIVVQKENQEKDKQKEKEKEVPKQEPPVPGSEFDLVNEPLPASQVKPPEEVVPNYFMTPEYIQYKRKYEERLLQIERENQAYKQLGSTFDGMAKNFNAGGDLIAEAFMGSFSNVRQSITSTIEVFKQSSGEMGENIMNITQSVLSSASSLISSFSSIMNASVKQDIQRSKRQTDERLNDLQLQLDAGTITEEQFNQKKYEIQLEQFRKESELKKQAFEQNKAIQIVQAIILSTQAALAAFTQGNIAGGPVVGGIFAGIAAAFGAIQVGLIASQQYPGDGAAPSRPSASTAVPSGNLGGTQPNAVAMADIGGRLTTTNREEEMRVYVLEKDITSAQGRTAQIKNRSRR